MHVRTFGPEVLDGDVIAVAASADMFAVCVWSDAAPQLLLFDVVSGTLIRSFGLEGPGEGRLSGNEGCRFTPDGCHILIAERNNNRLSLFTLTGDFVRCVGTGCLSSPTDVDFAPNGDILVVDSLNHRICVFSSDGSTLLRTIGGQGTGVGQLLYPYTLAVYGDALYVLDRTSARVQVFA